MYKVIISIYFFILCITSLSISQAGCKPQNLTVDSCVVLTNLIQQKWSANPPIWFNLGDSMKTFNDSLNTYDMYTNHPAFKACFNNMTQSDIKRLFGNPTTQFSDDTNSLAYCTSAIQSSGIITLITFHFKNGYLINIYNGRVRPME